MLAQIFGSRNNFDLDQSNQTFAAYEALGAQYIEALADGFNVDAKRFDKVMATLIESELAIIDTGGANWFGGSTGRKPAMKARRIECEPVYPHARSSDSITVAVIQPGTTANRAQM